jgi:hypothetical protein
MCDWIVSVSNDGAVERLEQEKEECKGSYLSFASVYFTDAIINATIDLLRHSAKEERLWNELEFQGCSGPVHDIIQTATNLEMFSSIIVRMADYEMRDDNATHFLLTCSALSSAMTYNSRLLMINVDIVEGMSREQFAALCDGLQTAGAQFEELILKRIVFTDHEVFSELAAALPHNSSLKTLHLIGCDLRDSQIVQLVEALVLHPSIRELSLGHNACGSQGMEALGQLLTNSKLQVLSLNHQHEGLASKLQILEGGLRENKFLERLYLSGNDLVDADLVPFAKSLSTCQRLEKLDLSHNKIMGSGLEIFASCIPKSLRRLSLYSNRFNEDGWFHLLRILQENPQLRQVDCHSDSNASKTQLDINHFRDFNRSGRILLSNGNVVPLSLWPVVLARANNLFGQDSHARQRRANVIFHLLQGPALMQRRVVIAGNEKRPSWVQPARHGKRVKPYAEDTEAKTVERSRQTDLI